MVASLYLQPQPTLQKGLLSLLSHKNHNIYSKSSRMHPPCRIRSGVVPLCQATPRRRAYVHPPPIFSHFLSARCNASQRISLAPRITSHCLLSVCVCQAAGCLCVMSLFPMMWICVTPPHGLAGQPAYVTGCLSLILGVFFFFYVPV